ncbi:MAG: hypothetical protein ACK5HC_06735, partial [Dolichospermum sp.]|nr:hypothetical protein [Anabaena sp. 49628_E55]
MPLLAVDFTDDITDNLITYKLQPSGKNSYYLDEKKYEELSNLKNDIAMKKEPPSQMLRVPTVLIPAVKELAKIHRQGQTTAVITVSHSQ